jgi:hypothetical protein
MKYGPHGWIQFLFCWFFQVSQQQSNLFSWFEMPLPVICYKGSDLNWEWWPLHLPLPSWASMPPRERYIYDKLTCKCMQAHVCLCLCVCVCVWGEGAYIHIHKSKKEMLTNMMMPSTLFWLHWILGIEIVHIRPPCSHNWYLSIFAAMTSRLISQCRRNWCQMSVVRRKQLASCQCLLQITLSQVLLRGTTETEITECEISNVGWAITSQP